MSCILRVSGIDLDLKELFQIKLDPDSIWEKGKPRLATKPNGEKHSTSGARYVVSEAGFDEFDKQTYAAIEFLKKHGNLIENIMILPGLDSGNLDFGIYRRDVAVQCDVFPSELVKLAGRFGLGIELSQYYKDQNDED